MKKLFIILLLLMSPAIASDHKMLQTIKMAGIELSLDDKFIYIHTSDPVLKYKTLKNPKRFYIDFKDSRYKRYVVGKLKKHPAVKDIRLGYHDSYYRFGFSIKEDTKVEVEKEKDGVKLNFLKEYVVIESIEFMPAEQE